MGALGPVAPGTARVGFPLPMWKWTPWQLEGWRRTANLARPLRVRMNAGRGAGKDILAERCVLRDALKLWARKRERIRTGDDGGLVLNPLVKVWVIAHLDDSLRQAWDDWRGMLKQCARVWGDAGGRDSERADWLFRESVRDGKFYLFGDGEIEIEQRLSATPGALRGPGVDLVHWTEFAHEKYPGQLERSWRTELPGTLARSGRLGRAYLTTTPVGPFGVFWEDLATAHGAEVIRGAELGDGGEGDTWIQTENGAELYGVASSFSNHFLTPEQVEQIEAERSNGWVFEQERLARFVIGDKGGFRVFERDWLEKCLVARPAEFRALAPCHERAGLRAPERRAVAWNGGSEFSRAVGYDGRGRVRFGVDVARFGGDSTAYVGTDLDTGRLVHAERKKGADGKEIVEDLVRLNGLFPGAKFRVDDTGHRGYVADFAPKELDLEGVQFGRAKEKWVGGLKLLLQMGELQIPDPETFPGLPEEARAVLRELFGELFSFQKKISQAGAVRYEHAPGASDDLLDGLLLSSMDLAEALRGVMDAKATAKKLGKLGL